MAKDQDSAQPGQDGEVEFHMINMTLDRFSVPALLINEECKLVATNSAAQSQFPNLMPGTASSFIDPEPLIWRRMWRRISQGLTARVKPGLIFGFIDNHDAQRSSVECSLWPSPDLSLALCVFKPENTETANPGSNGLGKFPEENPNPVLRISDKGLLLYANRASDALLEHWGKTINDYINGDSLLILEEAIACNCMRHADFNCGDRVFTVAFTPVAGSEFVNVYALDTTDKKKAESALRQALVEVEQLKNRLQRENRYLQDEIKQVHRFDEIIGSSKVQEGLLCKITQVASTDATVLILGETGTGKELIARAIHSSSKRAERPLVKVNCAALPAGLIESELFGHEKGAFTGATTTKTGRFELADGGTIFLDEIGDLPLELQAKLLRVLQEGELERVGGSRSIKINVRIIAATNRILANLISSGEFREDLFYRLNVFPIQSPPLRERRADIEQLAQHFLDKYSVKIGKKITLIDDSMLERLKAYDWPGNVRELENVVERAIILSEGDSLQLDETFDASMAPSNSRSRTTLKEMELDMIRSALDDCGWKIEGKRGAALKLDIAPSTLRERIKRYGIQKTKLRDEGQFAPA